MHRLAVKNTTLPDGNRIPKGTKLMVSTHKSFENAIFPKADTFDGYRFYRLRNEGLATAQFVSSSPSIMGFGHGPLACPGRFFANVVMKVALSHILLKYDFKLASENKPEFLKAGLFYMANPFEKLSVRRREEEIHL